MNGRRRTTIVAANRDSRVIVGEGEHDVYLALERAAAFLNPLDALRVGFALVDAATRALDRQFQQQQWSGVGHVGGGEGNVLESAAVRGG